MTIRNIDACCDLYLIMGMRIIANRKKGCDKQVVRIGIGEFEVGSTEQSHVGHGGHLRKKLILGAGRSIKCRVLPCGGTLC